MAINRYTLESSSKLALPVRLSQVQGAALSCCRNYWDLRKMVRLLCSCAQRAADLAMQTAAHTRAVWFLEGNCDRITSERTRRGSAPALALARTAWCWCARSSLAAATAIWKALITDADSSSGGSPTDLLPMTPCLLGESCISHADFLPAAFCNVTRPASHTWTACLLAVVLHSHTAGTTAVLIDHPCSGSAFYNRTHA